VLSKKTYFIFHLSIQNFKCIYIGLNEPAQVVEDFNLSDLCYVALQGGNNLCKAAVSGFVLFVNFECSSPNQSTAQPGQLQMMLLEQLQDLAGSRVCVFSILRQCLSLFQNLNLKKKKKNKLLENNILHRNKMLIYFLTGWRGLWGILKASTARRHVRGAAGRQSCSGRRGL